MAAKINIGFTGATGYIGGSVLEAILKRPDIASLHIRALVRSPEKAEKLKAFGIEPVIGSIDDLVVIEKLASESDVFFSICNNEHLPSIQAILRGAKQRYKATGVAPALIHTSGTGIVVDRVQGLQTSDIILNDTDSDKIEAIPLTQPHRKVDAELPAADKQGFVKTYTIFPPAVWGLAATRFTESGIQKQLNSIPGFLVPASLLRNPPRAAVVGEGVCIWNHVHVQDLADLYNLVFDAIVKNSEGVGHGSEGYYFAENGEVVLGEISKKVGEAMFELGKTTSSEPAKLEEADLTTLPQYLYDVLFVYLGSNSRCVGKRSRALGWKPTYTVEDMLVGIRLETEHYVKTSPV